MNTVSSVSFHSHSKGGPRLRPATARVSTTRAKVPVRPQPSSAVQPSTEPVLILSSSAAQATHAVHSSENATDAARSEANPSSPPPPPARPPSTVAGGTKRVRIQEPLPGTKEERAAVVHTAATSSRPPSSTRSKQVPAARTTSTDVKKREAVASTSTRISGGGGPRSSRDAHTSKEVKEVNGNEEEEDWVNDVVRLNAATAQEDAEAHARATWLAQRADEEATVARVTLDEGHAVDETALFAALETSVQETLRQARENLVVAAPPHGSVSALLSKPLREEQEETLWGPAEPEEEGDGFFNNEKHAVCGAALGTTSATAYPFADVDNTVLLRSSEVEDASTRPLASEWSPFPLATASRRMAAPTETDAILSRLQHVQHTLEHAKVSSFISTAGETSVPELSSSTTSQDSCPLHDVARRRRTPSRPFDAVHTLAGSAFPRDPSSVVEVWDAIEHEGHGAFETDPPFSNRTHRRRWPKTSATSSSSSCDALRYFDPSQYAMQLFEGNNEEDADDGAVESEEDEEENKASLIDKKRHKGDRTGRGTRSVLKSVLQDYVEELDEAVTEVPRGALAAAMASPTRTSRATGVSVADIEEARQLLPYSLTFARSDGLLSSSPRQQQPVEVVLPEDAVQSILRVLPHTDAGSSHAPSHSHATNAPHHKTEENRVEQEKQDQEEALVRRIVAALPDVPAELRNELSQQRRLLERLTSVQQEELVRLRRVQQDEGRHRMLRPAMPPAVSVGGASLDAQTQLVLSALSDSDLQRTGLHRQVEPYMLGPHLQRVAGDVRQRLPPLITITTAPSPAMIAQYEAALQRYRVQSSTPVAATDGAAQNKAERQHTPEATPSDARKEKEAQRQQQFLLAQQLKEEQRALRREHAESLAALQRTLCQQQSTNAALIRQLAEKEQAVHERWMTEQQRSQERLTKRLFSGAVEVLASRSPGHPQQSPLRTKRRTASPSSLASLSPPPQASATPGKKAVKKGSNASKRRTPVQVGAQEREEGSPATTLGAGAAVEAAGDALPTPTASIEATAPSDRRTRSPAVVTFAEVQNDDDDGDGDGDHREKGPETQKAQSEKKESDGETSKEERQNDDEEEGSESSDGEAHRITRSARDPLPPSSSHNSTSVPTDGAVRVPTAQRVKSTEDDLSHEEDDGEESRPTPRRDAAKRTTPHPSVRKPSTTQQPSSTDTSAMSDDKTRPKATTLTDIRSAYHPPQQPARSRRSRASQPTPTKAPQATLKKSMTQPHALRGPLVVHLPSSDDDENGGQDEGGAEKKKGPSSASAKHVNEHQRMTRPLRTSSPSADVASGVRVYASVPTKRPAKGVSGSPSSASGHHPKRAHSAMSRPVSSAHRFGRGRGTKTTSSASPQKRASSLQAGDAAGRREASGHVAHTVTSAEVPRSTPRGFGAQITFPLSFLEEEEGERGNERRAVSAASLYEAYDVASGGGRVPVTIVMDDVDDDEGSVEGDVAVSNALAGAATAVGSNSGGGGYPTYNAQRYASSSFASSAPAVSGAAVTQGRPVTTVIRVPHPSTSSLARRAPSSHATKSEANLTQQMVAQKPMIGRTMLLVTPTTPATNAGSTLSHAATTASKRDTAKARRVTIGDGKRTGGADGNTTLNAAASSPSLLPSAVLPHDTHTLFGPGDEGKAYSAHWKALSVVQREVQRHEQRVRLEVEEAMKTAARAAHARVEDAVQLPQKSGNEANEEAEKQTQPSAAQVSSLSEETTITMAESAVQPSFISPAMAAEAAALQQARRRLALIRSVLLPPPGRAIGTAPSLSMIVSPPPPPPAPAAAKSVGASLASHLSSGPRSAPQTMQLARAGTATTPFPLAKGEEEEEEDRVVATQRLVDAITTETIHSVLGEVTERAVFASVLRELEKELLSAVLTDVVRSAASPSAAESERLKSSPTAAPETALTDSSSPASVPVDTIHTEDGRVGARPQRTVTEADADLTVSDEHELGDAVPLSSKQQQRAMREKAARASLSEYLEEALLAQLLGEEKAWLAAHKAATTAHAEGETGEEAASTKEQQKATTMTTIAEPAPFTREDLFRALRRVLLGREVASAAEADEARREARETVTVTDSSVVGVVVDGEHAPPHEIVRVPPSKELEWLVDAKTSTSPRENAAEEKRSSTVTPTPVHLPPVLRVSLATSTAKGGGGEEANDRTTYGNEETDRKGSVDGTAPSAVALSPGSSANEVRLVLDVQPLLSHLGALRPSPPPVQRPALQTEQSRAPFDEDEDLRDVIVESVRFVPRLPPVDAVAVKKTVDEDRTTALKEDKGEAEATGGPPAASATVETEDSAGTVKHKQEVSGTAPTVPTLNTPDAVVTASALLVPPPPVLMPKTVSVEDEQPIEVRDLVPPMVVGNAFLPSHDNVVVVAAPLESASAVSHSASRYDPFSFLLRTVQDDEGRDRDSVVEREEVSRAALSHTRVLDRALLQLQTQKQTAETAATVQTAVAIAPTVPAIGEVHSSSGGVEGQKEGYETVAHPHAPPTEPVPVTVEEVNDTAASPAPIRDPVTRFIFEWLREFKAKEDQTQQTAHYVAQLNDAAAQAVAAGEGVAVGDGIRYPHSHTTTSTSSSSSMMRAFSTSHSGPVGSLATSSASSIHYLRGDGQRIALQTTVKDCRAAQQAQRSSRRAERFLREQQRVQSGSSARRPVLDAGQAVAAAAAAGSSTTKTSTTTTSSSSARGVQRYVSGPQRRTAAASTAANVEVDGRSRGAGDRASSSSSRTTRYTALSADEPHRRYQEEQKVFYNELEEQHRRSAAQRADSSSAPLSGGVVEGEHNDSRFSVTQQQHQRRPVYMHVGTGEGGTPSSMPSAPLFTSPPADARSAMAGQVMVAPTLVKELRSLSAQHYALPSARETMDAVLRALPTTSVSDESRLKRKDKPNAVAEEIQKETGGRERRIVLAGPQSRGPSPVSAFAPDSVSSAPFVPSPLPSAPAPSSFLTATAVPIQLPAALPPQPSLSRAPSAEGPAGVQRAAATTRAAQLESQLSRADAAHDALRQAWRTESELERAQHSSYGQVNHPGHHTAAGAVPTAIPIAVASHTVSPIPLPFSPANPSPSVSTPRAAAASPLATNTGTPAPAPTLRQLADAVLRVQSQARATAAAAAAATPTAGSGAEKID